MVAKQEQPSGTDTQKLLPVTLLSGFLGAGKTTLLKHILQENHGLKVAVIVNDMAELNIDAALITKGSGGQLVRRAESLVQMQNGCICCTLREDLLDEVSKLARDGKFDYCVIESTGISEPMQVAETFAFQLPTPEEMAAAEGEAGNEKEHQVGKKAKASKEAADAVPQKKSKTSEAAENGAAGGQAKKSKDKENGKAGNGVAAMEVEGAASDAGASCPLNSAPTLMDIARLDTCVTVVDASRFYDDLTSIEELADRHPEETPEGDMRNIAQLLVDQVEFADVILLNKADVVSKAQLKDIRAMLHRLNPQACIHETVQSRVPLSEVLNTKRFDMEKAGQAPGWLQAINATSAAERADQQAAIKPESEEYGVTSFVYRARRPFHPGRLYRSFMRKFFLTQIMPFEEEEEGEEGSEEEEEEEEGGGEEAMECGTDNGEGKVEKKGKSEEEKKMKKRAAGKKEAESEEEEEEDSSDEEEKGCAPQDKRDLSAYQEARSEVLAAAKKELGLLMRSKGFFWLATQNDSVLGWSSAGALLQVVKEGPWFDCLPKDEWPDDEEVKARIQADFCDDREVGDRRQELVFIGQNLKESAIRALLDSCLATKEEVAAAKEGKLRDELFGGPDEEGSE